MLKLRKSSASLIKLIQQRAEKFPNRQALLFLENDNLDELQLTYGELDKKARALAAYLQTQQVESQRVLLLYPSGLEFVVAFLGCLYAGVIAVPVACPVLSMFDKSRETLNAIMSDADVAGVLTTSIYLEKIKKVCDKENLFFITLDTVQDVWSEKYRTPIIDSKTVAYLQYTSGSTASPKAAIISHHNMFHSAKHLAKTWHYNKRSVTLTWAPHSHVYGLICGIVTPLFHGSLAILMPASVFVQRPLAWLEAISRYRVTHSGCPNFGYDLCVNAPDNATLSTFNLESWKVACNGGELVQAETIEKFSKKFSACGFRLNYFCSAYGMSEMAGPIAVGAYEKNPVVFKFATEALQRNSLQWSEGAASRLFVGNGRLLTGLHAVIVDLETLLPAKKGKIGEIWLRGESVAQGYWRRTEETEATFKATLVNDSQHYFRTGDLGFIHEKEICLVGRLKELIVIYGKKYYPQDLETLVAGVANNSYVASARAAFSIPQEGEEKLIFLQEVKSGFQDSETLISAIRKIITENFNLDVYEVVLVKENTLPKTSSGKLQRAKCKQFYLDNQLEAVGRSKKQSVIEKINSNSAALEDKFFHDFSQLLAPVLQISSQEIKLKKSISEYGFDSIKIVNVATQLNQQFGVNLAPAVLFEFKTLCEFVNYFVNHYAEVVMAYYGVENLQFGNKIAETLQLSDQKPTADVAIIGMSGIFPNANNIQEFWQNLLAGKSAIQEIPADRWQWQEWSSEKNSALQWGGFVPDIAGFDAGFFNISPREAELIDPQQRLFLQVAWNAIEDAGYSAEAISTAKTGLFVGIFSNNYAELLHKNNITDAYMTTGVTQSMLANRVSYLLNFNGPSETIDTACSSSLVAIHHAVRAIQNDDCDIAIAGGVNALITPSAYLSASQAGMLSSDGKCHTFDKDANGYVRAEGMAAILLKSLSQAIQDKDHIYGVIKGTAVNHGGHVSSLTVPNPNAQAEVIVEACKRANVSIDTISYIETHGTGTPLGDPIEINGLKKAFTTLNAKGHAYCALGALKTQIGHLESAAGIAGVVKVLLAMQHKTLPANLNFNELNPYIELHDTPFYLLRETQAWQSQLEQPRRAGISSFGFGGTNAHVVIEEHHTVTQENFSQKNYLLTLSAKSMYSLKERIRDLHDWLENASVSLAQVAFTLNLGRTHFNKRCAIVADSVLELRQTLKQLLEGQSPENAVMASEHHDVLANRPIFQELFKQLLMDIQQLNASDNHEYRKKLLALGDLYSDGYELDWHVLHPETEQRIALPTYPFEMKRYWVPNVVQAEKAESKAVEKPSITVTTAVSLVEAVEKSLIANVAELLKLDPNTVNISNSLSEQGFDSIAFSLLHLQLEEYYHIKLNPALFFTHNTIAALSQHFCETYPSEMEKVHQLTQQINEIVTAEISAEEVLPVIEKSIKEPIAVIGMHGIMPQSEDLQIFWENLIDGKNLITEIPEARWSWEKYFGDAKVDPTKTNSKWGGFIPDVDQFDAAFFNLSSREANLLDPQHRLFLETVWKAIEDAGYDPLTLSGQEIGVFVGVEFNEYQNLILEHAHEAHGYIATGNAHAMLPNRVSYFLNLRGPSEAVDTACSSAFVAINRAIHALQQGECTQAIAGGVNLLLSPQTYVVASQLGVLSSDGACKTFDKAANGYVRGEGVAALLLKPLSKAIEDNDSIYAVIKSSVVKHGGKAQSITAPNVTAQSQLLLKAYKEANVDPRTITFIETHGTGTSLGDPVEIEGIKLAFSTLSKGDEASCGLGAVKTQVGHLEPASGMAGILKVILAMQHQTLPGNLHLQELNEHIDLTNTPFYFVNKTQPWQRLLDAKGAELPLRAGVSSFGFGGTISHLVLEEANYPDKLSLEKKPYYLLALSAKNQESLKKKLVELEAWLSQNTVSLVDLSFTLNVGRSHFNHRAALVVDSIETLRSTLRECIYGGSSRNYFSSTTEPNNTIDFRIKDAMMNLIRETKPKEYRQHLELLAELYVKQQTIDWPQLYNNEKYRRLHIPTYPFNKKRYWFDLEFERVPEKVTPDTEVTESLDATIDYLKKIFATVLRLKPETLQPEMTYENYGVDSLLGLEIVTKLEKDYGILPKTILFENTTLQALAAYLTARKRVSVTAPVLEKQLIATTQYDDIAIIGIAGRYPLAENINELWENLVSGKNCVENVPSDRWDYRDYPVSVGTGEKYFNHGGFLTDVDKFDPLFFNISPRDAAFMDPQERLFMQTAWETLEDAGYTRARLENKVQNNVGVFAGVTHHFYPIFAAEEWGKGNPVPINTQIFSIANRLSYFLNLNGPSYAIDTACSSSLTALHLAVESLQRGECKMAIAGGVNLSLHPSKYHMLGSYNFLSEEGRCASFAEGGAGYVPSEGVGAVLLKPLSLAQRDNDRILAVIKASSTNHGGKTSGYTVPNPNAQAELIKTALAKGKIDPRTISYVEAHGTGTALGDPIEIRGLQAAYEAFTQDKQFCAIGSIKSNIGHLEAAAGISQLTKVILQMQHRKLVPSLHAEKLNPYIEFEQTPFVVQRELAEWSQPLCRAAISSFGAGGTNVHVIVEAMPEKITGSDDVPFPFSFVLSAMTEERLLVLVKRMYEFIKTAEVTQESQWLHALCYTLQVGREAFPARFACVIHSKAELINALEKYIAGKSTTALNEEAQDWIGGMRVEWEGKYKNPPIMLSLPTYPFEKRRCWIPTIETLKTSKVEDIYGLSWLLDAEPSNEMKSTKKKKWLLFSDTELGFILQDEIGRDNCLYCFQGESFSQHDNNNFYINPNNEQDYISLLDQLKNHDLTGIIYLWSVNATDQVNNLFFLLKTLSKNALQTKLLFNLVTRNAQAVTANDNINIHHYSLWAMTRLLSVENGHYDVLLLDLENKKSLREEANIIAKELNQFSSDDNQIAYRDQQRYLLRLQEVQPKEKIWNAPQAALITGGLGALGIEVATWLAKQGTHHLLLLGVTQLPDRPHWQEETNPRTKEKIEAIVALESLGATVCYQAIDVADAVSMQRLIQKTETSWGIPFDGVFHLAGVTTESIPFEKMTHDILQTVLHAKVRGALVLHELFQKSSLDCFVLFSSIAALPFFGMKGLSAYATANAFLDGLALHRQQQGLPALSINWAAWAEKGMGKEHDHSDFLKAVGMSALTVAEAITKLSLILHSQLTQAAVMTINWQQFLRVNSHAKKIHFFDAFSSSGGGDSLVVDSVDPASLYALMLNEFATLLLIDPKEIDDQADFQKYGVDSIVGIHVVTNINEKLGEVLSPMDLYRYPTLSKLCDYVSETLFTKKQTDTSLSADEISELIKNELNDIDNLL